MKPVLIKLKNGLRVVFIDTKVFPSLTTLLLIGAGSRYENKVNNGIAHFFEHMAFKGSNKYPTALEISTLLDGLGSEHNAFTAKDHTGYWIKAPTKHYSTLIDILSEMILNPLLQEEEINREKGVIVEEINMYEDTPQYKVWDLFEGLLYPGNALGHDTTGRKETVTKFNRNTFTDYMREYYSPSNAVLVVAGGMSHGLNLRSEKDDSKFNTFRDLIEQKFSQWKDVKTNQFEKFVDRQNRPEILVHYKKTEQAHLVLGYRGLSRDNQDKYVQSLLMAILGGGMSSRLFYEVRERRGLCYYIQSGRETFAETGYVFTRAGLNIDINKINEAIKVIVSEHKKISDGKLSDEELIKAKEMIKGRLILSLEDSNNLANFIGKKLLLENKIEKPEDLIKKIEQVSKDEIIDLAKKIFIQEKLNLAVIGPFREEEIKI